jgi:ABC-2 type transport system ATP-binding protein
MINIENLTFGYHKKQAVLENLDLHLKPGHIYGLLGRNGAGKSSLLHNICGLLFPDAGTCQVAGKNPADRSPEFLQQVFLLPEEIYLPNISIKSSLDKLQSMSYGQKKKVMISFALATQAKVLLMDEPTNGLDIPSKRQFRKIIAGIIKEDQLIIISTHQVKDLDSLIDFVLILEDKKIILHQPVDHITEKLTFKQVMSLDEIATPIYSEGALKGYAVVAVNNKQEHSRLDMEMFFNAVLTEKQLILSQFN